MFTKNIDLSMRYTGDGLMVKAVVPRYKVRGETAVLRCDFELEGALLYAVKWYRENEEFYRYVPKSDPQKTSYIVDGIKVDVSIVDVFIFFLIFLHFDTTSAERS
jgi:hypothetical protein